MKIFFRYLLMRLFQMFALVLLAMTLIWIMVDLYGNLDDFLEHKVNFSLILRFYFWNIPRMLVVVMPAALLFSMLFTLLTLNRRSELVAFQSGGMAPVLMFSPFLCFALICTVVLAYDMNGPSATAEVTRDRLLKQVKGGSAGKDGYTNLAYVDNINHRVWFFEYLNTRDGTARGVAIRELDAAGRDLRVYGANAAKWNGQTWRLEGGVSKIVAADDSKTSYEALDLDINTAPKQLSLIVSQPEQLTVSQLEQYIATSTSTPENLAKYRMEWWYRWLYPFCLPVLMLFALLYGMQSDRRSSVAGIFWSLVVFVSFTFLMWIFKAVGKHGHLPPYVAVSLTEFIFAAIGLSLLAWNNGWWWQAKEWWKERQAARAALRRKEPAG